MWWITIQPETHRSPFTGATFRIESSVVHTAQAVTETLLFKNFGLDTTTTAAQGLAWRPFVAGLWVSAHFGSAARPGRVAAIQCAGNRRSRSCRVQLRNDLLGTRDLVDVRRGANIRMV